MLSHHRIWQGAGHLEDAIPPQTLEESVLADDVLPVLCAVGQKHFAADAPFDVGPEAIHVCKYLAAYEDETNEWVRNLFEGKGKRPILKV